MGLDIIFVMSYTSQVRVKEVLRVTPKVRHPDKGYSRRMRNLPLSQTLGKESKRSMGTSNGDTAPAY